MESVRVGDDYRIERKLASGGFGTVYRATQLSLDRQVCIKRIHPHMLGQGEIDAVSMFLDEARLVAKLRHENVCRVIDCLLDAEGVPVIVMEYIEGCDVHSLLKRHGPLPWRTVAYILVEVLKALAEAHEPDPSTERPALIHRDIKPSNIMLGNNGSVVVVDFGIARAVEDASGLNYTDNYKGSLAYAAPEQLRPGTPFDRRVDLWQLGVTAWEMLNGCLKRPFEDESIEPRGTMNRQVWVIRNILEDRRRPIREVFAHLPPEADPLLQLIDELLKPADSRIRNAYDVLERLAHAGLGLVTERREVMALVQEICPQGPRTVPDTPGYGRGDSPSSAEPTGTTDPSPPPPSAALASGEALPDRPPAALAPPAGPPDAPAHRMTRTVPLPDIPSEANTDTESVSSANSSRAAASSLGAPSSRALLLFAAASFLVLTGVSTFLFALYYGRDAPAGIGTGETTTITQTAPNTPPSPALPATHAPPKSEEEPVPEESTAEDDGDTDIVDDTESADTEAEALPELLADVPDDPSKSTTEDSPTPSPPPRFGPLRVVVIPMGDVIIDGKSRGRAPVTARLSPGPHEVRVGRGGRTEEVRTVSIRAGERRQERFTLLLR